MNEGSILNNTVIKTPVTIGKLEGSQNVIITEGLKDGQQIVIAGISKLQEGMKVRPWQSQREGK